MLAILTTHPIQYQVPIWKGLAARGKIPFKVFYMSDRGLQARFDPGFGKSLSWDIDLLGGYECEFLDTYKCPRFDSFWSLWLRRGFGRALRRRGAEVLWVQGWHVAAYWQAVFEARKAGTEVSWLRGRKQTRAAKRPGPGNNSNAGCCGRYLAVSTGSCTSGRPISSSTWNKALLRSGSRPLPYCVDNARFTTAAAAARPGAS